MAPAIRVAAAIIVSAARDPSRMRTRRPRPIPRDPDVTIAPVPEAIDPHITRPRCVTNSAVDGRSRRRRSYGVVRSTRGAPCQRKHSQRGHQPKCSFHSVSRLRKRAAFRRRCGLHRLLMNDLLCMEKHTGSALRPAALSPPSSPAPGTCPANREFPVSHRAGQRGCGRPHRGPAACLSPEHPRSGT